MTEGINIRPIAKTRSDFPEKFGIPRQSGLVEDLVSYIIFEPEYRDDEALRGILDYSHLWLIWNFSENNGKAWSATVRPPRLGGNIRRGVFATRSPHRPNPLGLSCVSLLGLEKSAEHGTMLVVSGADLMDGSPIFDIKPYIPYADSKPEALTSDFSKYSDVKPLTVEFPIDLLDLIREDLREPLIEVLKLNPRPQYHNDSERIYGMAFSEYNVKFRICDEVLLVVGVE